MGFSLNGEWQSEVQWVRSEGGAFVRDQSVFRDQISDGENTPFPIENGRYHLYISGACPWAHRVMLVRQLLGLEDFVSVSTVHPLMMEDGWVFSGHFTDALYGANRLHEIYVKADTQYTGRVTVPILFDRISETIVNNESAEIIRMFNSNAPRTKRMALDLYPAHLRTEIDIWNARIYDGLNNGVYRCEFATTQAAYEDAVRELFGTLDALETHLSDRIFMMGDQLTETDVRLFPTLIRFDPVYHGHFKCNLKKLSEFPNLHAYTQRFFQLGDIASTCALDEFKTHYYGSHLTINPTGIIPVGPTHWP